MALESSGRAAAPLDVWPRAVMATLLLLISLLTAHLVQLTWFNDAEAAVTVQSDLAQHR